MARWKPLDDYSPIGRLLVEYMWTQRPPLLPSQFAARMGLPKQLVSSWLTNQVLPTPAVLLHLSRQMNQPVSRLLEAAGYTTPGDPLLDVSEAWSYVAADIARHRDHAPDGIPPDTLLAWLHSLQHEDISRRLDPAPGSETGAPLPPTGLSWRRPRPRLTPESVPASDTTDTADEDAETGTPASALDAADTER